jgi:uncharacterized protein (DUF2235 family)
MPVFVSNAVEKHMAKNIIFCADGTWNGPPDEADKTAIDRSDSEDLSNPDTPTNVFKLFQNLAGALTEESATLRNEAEKFHSDASGQGRQMVKYLHGVGDSANKLHRFLGGALGIGVIARVVRGYTFISRYYEPGDAIYIAGFSRGAYTARALGGMIATVGLLNRATYDPADKDTAYGLGISAWHKFREKSLQGEGLLTKMADRLLNLAQSMSAKTLAEDGLITNVPIKAVAVWDTVGSLGIPVYAGNGRVDVFRFTNSVLSDKVEYGFHAMAINEKRQDFPVAKWEERRNIEQVWMMGAHADVGGGYPANESALSNIGLSWMMNKLAGVGATFKQELEYSLDPGELSECIRVPFHTPWEQSPFKAFGKQERQLQTSTDVFHETVLKRLQAGNGYALPGCGELTATQLSALRLDPALYVAASK